MEIKNIFDIIKTGIVFFLITTFSGCSDDNTIEENAIGFDCSTATLRATETTLNNLQYFRVTAVWAMGGGEYSRFMDKLLVEKQGADWVYSPERYWPNTGSVSFFAYSPASSSCVHSFSVNNATNEVVIEYEVPTDPLEQEDFMVATSLEKTGNPVQLDFEHALSFATFHARHTVADSTFRINEIKLVNLYSVGKLTGTANGTTTVWAWDSGSSALKDYAVYQKYAFEVPYQTYGEIGNLMILPQTIDSNFEIVITYNYNTFACKLSDSFEFEAGKRYVFYLDLNEAATVRNINMDAPKLEVKSRVVSAGRL